ncbi:hypothetical protein TNCV_4031291 [Trichonephila clavipes]|nr:hypothetical protein TNCV_4031291 [Trichonephila clavipes]
MAARVASNSAVRYFYAEVKKFHLRPVKKLSFQFDPFHENAKTVRDFYFHISSKKIRKTNQSCVLKADVVNDRSEPTISVDLKVNNGEVEGEAQLLTADLIREGLKFATSMEQHFRIHNPAIERALKFQCNLVLCSRVSSIQAT